MSFLYSVLLRLMNPVAVAVLLLVAGAAVGRRKKARRVFYAMALVVLLVCGNGFLVKSLMSHLEDQYHPPQPMPTAAAIIVLSGGILDRSPPRPTVEVGDAGDRVLYAAELFRQGKAPQVIVTGNVATGGIAPRPEAENMAELLTMVGVPTHAIVLETKAENTHDHAVNLCPVLVEKHIARVLLVTSAMHMPRSVGVFRRVCPAVEIVPAPTDFRVTEEIPVAWYRSATRWIPSPLTLLGFTDAAHEYIGIIYYRLRGWM